MFSLGLLLAVFSVPPPEMVLVEEGSYRPLYSERKKEPIEAEIVDSFWMDKVAVTQKDYLKFVKKHPRWRRSKIKRLFADSSYLKDWASDLELPANQDPDSPVRFVSWFAARAYCQDQNKRLPTTAEWERAAAAFSSEKDLKSRILEWYSRPNPNNWPKVGRGAPNDFGVYDLHGLIWEWVEDFNSNLVTGESRADASLDQGLFCGAGALSSTDKNDYAAFMRYGFRNSLKAAYTTANLGFRCVKSRE